MSPIDRRTFLTLTASAAVAVAAGCSPDPTPEPEPTETPTLPPEIDDLPEGVRVGSYAETSQRPDLTASFGPNGTHFPEGVDWPGSVALTELEVDPDWATIAAAIGWLTPERVAEGVTIRVAPGELTGQGAGSASSPVLEAIGDPGWERNVLIVPRDGFGSVTVVGDGFRLNEVSKLSLFGFTGPDVSFVLTHCEGVHVGWGIWDAMSITLGGAGIGLYELALGFRRDPHDTAAVRPTENFAMVDLERHGCVFGPSVKPDGDPAHCDTLQLERTGEGEFGPFYSEDCVDIGSSNAAIMIDGTISTVEYRHSMVLAGRLPWEIFPLQAGDYDGTPNAFSGAAMDVRVFDSIVVGALGRTGFTQMENSLLSYEPQEVQQPSESGRWTVDTSISNWTADEIFSQTSNDFSPEALAAQWTW